MISPFNLMTWLTLNRIIKGRAATRVVFKEKKKKRIRIQKQEGGKVFFFFFFFGIFYRDSHCLSLVNVEFQ